MTIGIKDFYLNTPMKRYEYMRFKMAEIPEGFIDEYNSRDKATADGYVYLEIRNRGGIDYPTQEE